MKILLVENDDPIACPILEDLRHQKHSVDYASDGIEGSEFAQTISHDLILLDVMFPRLDGVSLCCQIRASCYYAYILMIAACDPTSDKILSLDAGADDYLVKPLNVSTVK